MPLSQLSFIQHSQCPNRASPGAWGWAFTQGAPFVVKSISQWDKKFAKSLGALAGDPSVPLAPARALPAAWRG